jgi:hypothetical protein
MDTRDARTEVANPDEEAVLERVREGLRSIDFGSILIKIHQGKVVGIETATKVRLNDS